MILAPPPPPSSLLSHEGYARFTFLCTSPNCNFVNVIFLGFNILFEASGVKKIHIMGGVQKLIKRETLDGMFAITSSSFELPLVGL